MKNNLARLPSVVYWELEEARDRQRQRQADQALQVREARYRAVAETANDAIITVDATGMVLEWNAAAERMYGYTREQAVGQPVAQIIPERFVEAHLGRLQEIRNKDTPEGIGQLREVSGKRRDGSEFPMELSLSVYDIGAERYYTAIIRDISERREAEQKFKASEQSFKGLVDSMEGIVWEADATTFTFTFVSIKAERLLGYPIGDWLKPGFWTEHLHPEDRKWAVEYCTACVKRLETHDFEYRFLAMDGHAVWLRDIVSVVTENGKPRWLRGIMVDVTHIKEAKQHQQTLMNERDIAISGREAGLTRKV